MLSLRFRALVLALVCLSAPASGQGAAPQQAPPTFRAGTSLVPVDVRVLDRSGRPVTDLTEKDFQVLENGVRQPIQHFSIQRLEADPAAAAGGPGLRRRVEGTPLGPQSRRVWLIVLGRGRLQPPAKGVDGMMHLVRERLLPQDIVAVTAWNRATEFTTNHAKVLELLERFKSAHERIEADLVLHFSGLAAIYGGPEIPGHIQTKINAVFAGPNAIASNTVIDGAVPDAARLAADKRRISDVLQRAEITATRQPGEFLPEVETPESLGLDMSFDEFAQMSAQSSQDVGKIMAGIQYLRQIDGEKHLLFVSPSGVFLPSADNDRSIASLAADARIVIDILHTGGVSPAGGFDWRKQTSGSVAQDTGGMYTSLSQASTFVDRLDTATRFQYVLGYAPANPQLDGRFRRIAVRVNRPGLTVQYRQGYFARRAPPPMDRERAQAFYRVAGAASHNREIRDIALVATAVNARSGDSREVRLEVKIPPQRLSLIEKDGRRVGSIEVAVFCSDREERLIGQSWNTITLEMTPQAYEKLMASGLTYSARVPVRFNASYAKVIVYDPGSDVVGSAMIRVK
jgi:VWFA-related protein